MRRRLRCFWHSEATPSLIQRKNGWYCYGACQRLYSNEEVETKTGETYEYEEDDDTDAPDIRETLNYIESLPKVEYRGLRFPTDEGGYYIVWPEGDFYKYRKYTPGTGPKYIGPKGRIPPLFWAKKVGARTLCVSEGEISSMSLAIAFPEFDHCSPGSASMFNDKNLQKYLPEFKQYSRIIVVLDQDPPGEKALIEAKAFLLYKIPFLSFITLTPDPNEILCEHGPEKLREEVQRKNSQ